MKMLSIFKKNQYLCSPVSGKMISLFDVKDEAFSSKMLGEGCAIIPSDNKIYSPCDGKVNFVFKTKHAIGIVSNDGLEIIIHIGLDTVKLDGVGFECHVMENQEVKKGELLVEFNSEYLNDKKIDLTTPIVVTNHQILKNLQVIHREKVNNGDNILEYYK